MSMNRIFLYVENNSFGFSRLQIFFEDNKTKYNITNNNRTDTIIIYQFNITEMRLTKEG